MSLGKTAYYLAGRGLASVERRAELGTNIYDEEWDVCIILDSARTDLLAQLAPSICDRYQMGRRWSVGSVTTEWLANTFRTSRADAIADTALVTAHPHTETVFDNREYLTNPDAAPVAYPEPPAVEASGFGNLYRLYEHATGPDSVVEPSTMATATVTAYHRHGSRVVAHWMQPHEPWIASDAPLKGGPPTERNVWRALAAGEVDSRDAWKSYRATHRLALQHAQRVADSLDATVLVTADHGNLFGELGQWGHPFGMMHPAVRRVPWLLIDGCQADPVEPNPNVLKNQSDADRRDQLEALGYR